MKQLLLAIASAALLVLPVRAQTFSVDWYTVDGGAGSSTGGVYTVTGTIGQPDAGVITGGNFTLAGGFWGVITAVQTEGAPALDIFISTTNTVVVSWPAPSAGWVLQQNTNSVNSVSWSNVVNGILDDGTTKTLVINPPSGNRFYRLEK